MTLEACATRSDDTERCGVDAAWSSSTPSVATVSDGGLVTGVSPGETTISAVYERNTGRATATVVEAGATFEFDPTPPTTIMVGDTGHFRVNVIQDGRRRRVTEGVTSSANSVPRLNLEGDRWRYQARGAGTAEIRVVAEGERQLTHKITVESPPQPDHSIVDVRRYDSVIDDADWLRFTWRAFTTADRFSLTVRFQQGAFFSECTETWYRPRAGEQEGELSIPDVCGTDDQWSEVRISPADGRLCEGCGTFRRSSLPERDNLQPVTPDPSEVQSLREEALSSGRGR